MSALIFGACAAQPTTPADPPVLQAAHVAPPPVTEDLKAPLAEAAQPPKPRVNLEPALQAAAATLDSALSTSGARVAGWWRPLSAQPDYRELLDPERSLTDTLSLGPVGAGQLLNARALPFEGAHYSVIERHRSRGTHFATGAMIELLTDAAKAVHARAPGPKLRVGNMSLQNGGDMRWSRSHTSGRDADLAFYCMDKATGEPVEAPDLLRFDASGMAIERPDLVFDTQRNWELVKALLEHPTVDIQWLFISNPLKSILLHYARAQGADPELIARAAKVLHQPTDALPHDDHLHLRIACPENDRLEGCLDYGPRWEWVDWHYDALRARSLAIARAFESPDASIRLRALDLLERIRSPYAPVLALSQARREPSAEVRLRALEVATNIPVESGAAVVEALKFVGHPEFSLPEKAYAYRLLRRSIDPFALEPLKQIVSASDASPQERRLAADALIHFMDPELVPFLIAQLEVQPAQVGERLAVALRRITNHSEGIDWELAEPAARENGLRAWRAWWSAHQESPRQAWLAQGFSAHGMSVTQALPLDMNAVDALIDLLASAPEHVVYNANLELKRITGRWTPLEAWDRARLQKSWSRWWKWWQQNQLDDEALVAAR